MEEEHQHTWLIRNFPKPVKNNLKKPNSYDRLKQVLLDYNRPILVFTGMGTNLVENNDTVLDDIFSQLSDKQLATLRKEKIDVYWYEPLTFVLTPNLRKRLKGYSNLYICRYGFWEEWDKDLSPKDFTILDLDYLQHIAEKYNLLFNVYTCDYNIDKLIDEHYPQLYKNIRCFCYDIFIRDISPYKDYHGVWFKKNHNKFKKKLTYKFISYNLRFSSHRHLTVANIAHRNSFYTWTYTIDEKISAYNYGWVDPKYFDCDLIDFVTKNFVNKKQNVVGDIDFVPSQHVVDYFHSNSVNQAVFGFDDRQMVKKIQEGFLYVVTESRYAQPIANISEKTLRSFQAMRPVVLVAPPYSLEYLHKLGFKTFSKWWDESYDKIENHSKRFGAVLDIINYIDTLDMKQLQEIIIDMEDVLYYNYQHNLKLKNCRRIV